MSSPPKETAAPTEEEAKAKLAADKARASADELTKYKVRCPHLDWNPKTFWAHVWLVVGSGNREQCDQEACRAFG
jgi:hypothetical protein